MLIFDNVSKTYHSINGEIIALDNLSFSVNEKDFISIIGPSGCGKSTILNLIAGLEKCSMGKIIINDKRIGYMFQNDALFDWLTVLDNTLLGLKIKNELTKENKEYVLELLKKYDLYDFKDKYPNSLSGGMKQRVGCLL